MFFYIDFKPSGNPAIRVVRLDGEAALPPFPEANVLYYRQGKQFLRVAEAPGGKLMLLGDPVFSPNEKLFGSVIPEPGKADLDALFREIKGHYYWFYLPVDGSQLYCGSSFGAIYPVYYCEKGQNAIISSSSFTIAEKTNSHARDKRNLLERLLFNYPFFNSTWWEGIKLLEAHRYVRLSPPGPPAGGERASLSASAKLSHFPEMEKGTTPSTLTHKPNEATPSPPRGCRGGLTVEGAFDISDYFGTTENDSRDSLPALAELFEAETRLFFPDEAFGISLTGGFDGRTLTAAAKNAGRRFFTYSFGRPDSTDVTMPAAQAARLKIDYQPIYLDEQYVENESLASAWSLMRLTEFNGNFGRPHYHYAAQRLSEKTRFILTGNFGSELFRALHQPGVMISECLISVFAAADNSWKDVLKRHAAQWDNHFFRDETESLIADIEHYLEKMKGREANHKFYHFVFNEIFRKYFGAELVMQSAYLNNRTPYLNLRFFRELNRTIWSGVHARLFEKVKSKRMKGQMFYATFIRRSDKKMYGLATNKGYSPADVLEPRRLPLLAGKVLWHKYINHREIDDNSVHAFIQRNCKHISTQIKAVHPPFIQKNLERSYDEINREINIEKWVKFYSIAAGWDAAGTIVAPSFY